MIERKRLCRYCNSDMTDSVTAESYAQNPYCTACLYERLGLPKDFDSEPFHFVRTCGRCGLRWESLHCAHDGHQRPCPRCGLVAAVLGGERECEFQRLEGEG